MPAEIWSAASVRNHAAACTRSHAKQNCSVLRRGGIAGGIGYIPRLHAWSIQQFTKDFESGPGSHPRTSRDFRQLPAAATTLVGYVWGHLRPRAARTPHSRYRCKSRTSARQLSSARCVLFESEFGIRIGTGNRRRLRDLARHRLLTPRVSASQPTIKICECFCPHG